VADLSTFAELVPADHGLAVLAVSRTDGSTAASVVNAGVLAHPVTGARVVGLVARGDAHKLRHLRARPRATVVLRAGWRWCAVEGAAQLAGPHDPLEGLQPEEVAGLLRNVFAAAGGTHKDWDEYDRVMAAEGRTAVLIAPQRVYGNG
jgi:PPOX class probable F420-dependent enzyme